jgi:hypothetical protein
VARQLDHFEWIAEQAAEAWEKSKRPRRSERRIERSAGEGEGPAVEVETTVLTVLGDPRSLAEIRVALAESRMLVQLARKGRI